MHQKNILSAGKPLNPDSRVLIMIHGRGSSAANILSFASNLDVEGFSLLAPQATNHTWYPYSFLAPPKENEPWLSSALAILNEMVIDITDMGISRENIFFLGFSQGACLTLEFVTRNAGIFGGVLAFTGGLIGDRIYSEQYIGDFQQTPFFLGSSDPDPHVPVERVQSSANLIKNMNANVTVKIYPHMGHTINQDEIMYANQMLISHKDA
ncbi:MAG: phospholipase [Bacteroidetes bacterium]|nr:MAG: phospholipase [Bacteroidota bacterium]